MKVISTMATQFWSIRRITSTCLFLTGIGLALFASAGSTLTGGTSEAISAFGSSIVGLKTTQDLLPPVTPGSPSLDPTLRVPTPFLAASTPAEWTITPSPNVDAGQTLVLLNSGTCVSASDCWAVGYFLSGSYYQTLTEHWDGSSWTIIPSPSTADSKHNVLTAVACVSAAECWAVGNYNSGNNNQTLIERWDGTAWTIVPSPNSTLPENNFLSSVACVSSAECWAVGHSSVGSSADQTLIERWDGTAWSIVASPNQLLADASDLNGVACASASDCWAVGQYTAGLVFQTLIEHWNGASWSIAPSPNTSSADNNQFLGVTCASAAECWAVGGTSAGGGLISRWNGIAWTIVPSNEPKAAQFSSVTCSSGSDCWTVGYYNGAVAQTLIERWKGTAWVTVSSPNASTTQSQYLKGTMCSSASECWAVGVSFGPYFQSLIERWDGSSWTVAASANPLSKQYNQLFGMTCASLNECWAVGGYGGFTGGRNYLSLILRWNGTSWSTIDAPNTSDDQTNIVNSVACNTPFDCWGVGYHDLGPNDRSSVHTLAEHWDGTAWSIVSSPNATGASYNLLLGVTCASSSECWGVGYYRNAAGVLQTLIEEWNGTSWNVVNSPDTSSTQGNGLFEVKCSSALDCWTVGYSFTGSASGSTIGSTSHTLIEHWDGTSWTIIPSQDPANSQSAFLLGLACPVATECWAVGSTSQDTRNYKSLIERWDGTSWKIVASPNVSNLGANYLNSVACASTSQCWAAGYSGGVGAAQTLIERWDGTAWTIVSSQNAVGATENNLHAAACLPNSDCWVAGVDRGSNGVAQTLIERFTSGASALIPTSIVSEKTHSIAGTYPINLPLSGSPGIECRRGGATGDHTMVFTFPNALTSVGGATVTSGTGSVSSSHVDDQDAHRYIVSLTGVGNAQVLTVGLSGVVDASGNSSNSVSGSMRLLLGDTNADGAVNSGDAQQTRNVSGQFTDGTNFRSDVNTDGTINSGDAFIVRSKSGTGP